MKITVLILLFLVNVIYLVNFMVGSVLQFSVVTEALFVLSFLIGIVLSITYLLQSKRHDQHPFLSIAVLSFSLASFGCFTFFQYLANMMG
ncbi:hypothetical protein [Alkalihalobacillus sp. R86527]|uniref:hypothetical protein n=1 Tax=Alkalihalobacillus sp. R86527 TaxID=3093863 RepID=UPI0036700B18